MNKLEVITRVKSLNLPTNSYVVFGSCPMAIVGIREARDIDLLVSGEVMQTLKQQGWEQISKGFNDNPYVYDVFEAHDNWDFSAYSPSLAQLQATSFIVEGIPFAALEEVRKWKAASINKKFLQDVQLIDEYISNNQSQSSDGVAF